MLEGYKTYIIAVVLFALAGLNFAGIVIAGLNEDPGTLILTALGLITGRLGAKADVAKALGK